MAVSPQERAAQQQAEREPKQYRENDPAMSGVPIKGRSGEASIAEEDVGKNFPRITRAGSPPSNSAYQKRSSKSRGTSRSVST